MTVKVLAVLVLALGGVVGVTGSATAGGGDAETTVTIKAEGTDLSGVVKSPRPNRCADDRKVIVFKQRGERGGGDDINFAIPIRHVCAKLRSC